MLVKRIDMKGAELAVHEHFHLEVEGLVFTSRPQNGDDEKDGPWLKVGRDSFCIESEAEYRAVLAMLHNGWKRWKKLRARKA